MLCKFHSKSTVVSNNKPKTKLKCGYGGVFGDATNRHLFLVVSLLEQGAKIFLQTS